MKSLHLRAWWGLALGLAALLWLGLLQLLPSLAEILFRSGALSALAFCLAWSVWPSPIAGVDLLLGAALLALLLRWVRLLWRWRRQHMPAPALCFRELRVAANAIGCVLAVFALSFGAVYARPPLPARWQLPADGVELASLTEVLVNWTNQAYVALHGTEDLGRPTPLPSIVQFESQLDRSLDSLLAREREPAPARWGRPPARWPTVSFLMDRFGLSGFFFPWSGEANINRGMPAIAAVHALAHEKAHQRGFAPENEANFVAIVAGLNSEASISRYAAVLFAQRQALRTLLVQDPPQGESLLALRYAGVQRDVDDLRAYWARFEGPAQEFAQRSNDLYLRAHGVEGGTRSYAGSLGLLLRYASQHELLQEGD